MLTFDGRINILVEAPYIQSDETVKANTKIKRKQGSITKTKQDDKRTDQAGQVKTIKDEKRKENEIEQ